MSSSSRKRLSLKAARKLVQKRTGKFPWNAGWKELAVFLGAPVEIGKRGGRSYTNKCAFDGIPTPAPRKQIVSIAPATDDFLRSFEWRKLRMQALKKYGARCQCCGASPADGQKMNVDHIKPRMLYPQLALDINNLQVLCEVCNHGKGNWDVTDWRSKEMSS